MGQLLLRPPNRLSPALWPYLCTLLTMEEDSHGGCCLGVIYLPPLITTIVTCPGHGTLLTIVLPVIHLTFITISLTPLGPKSVASIHITVLDIIIHLMMAMATYLIYTALPPRTQISIPLYIIGFKNDREIET